MAFSSSKKRKTVRNYHKDFLLLGFYPSTTESEKPEYVECGLIMTKDSMKKSKLLAHQQLKHSSCVGKELSYFEKSGVTPEACSKAFRFPLEKGKG